MFNTALLKTEVQDFIRNFQGDISKLAFSYSPFENVSVKELMQQIESRKKAEKKLPTWFKTRNILFPPKKNLEQTSSEITAKYKATLISGDSIADITGGFGVDSFYFSDNFNSVIHFETDEALSNLAKHNFQVFGKENVSFLVKDGLEAIFQKHFNVIYADPSRRHDKKGKVFMLADCQPNIPDNIKRILEHCDTFLLKSSPMLDMSIGLDELKNVKQIHIVAVENEVKELLWLLEKTSVGKTEIKTINFTKSGAENFDFEWNKSANAEYDFARNYLFEPNAAILKSGAFTLISKKFKLKKLHQNTHLYTGNNMIDFPGRSFFIEKIVPYSKAEMRAALTFKKANIATRNFPESVESLRKKWKIADGGSVYLFFVTNVANKKEMIICSKV
ncbi:class I SAM-dependent methyltransferase [Aequorivita sp. SDUM287046]|uniref:Class I SAM-dependent methyltransferase n=1 Tax=Aequorivita aurantiaca TaxID=3053356 RepID=A0ABT8DEG2_9FLAO|nr:class I SAM-dependent methyltransferase [Aequorivita aurantiaca]MDN3723528.1 class I SAM-dependent methyltransferase [Aequorivita aurantiaca]